MVHIDVNTIFTSELQFCLKYLATAIPSPNIPVDIMMLIQADRECKLAGRKFVNTVDGVDGQGKLRGGSVYGGVCRGAGSANYAAVGLALRPATFVRLNS